VDRNEIRADGKYLAFITMRVNDKNGLTVPRANNSIKFEIEDNGEIVATDNGDPTNLVPFPSHKREAFNGLVLAIIRLKPGTSSSIKVIAKSPGLKEAQVVVKSQ
jgi:beta-galactosidase